MTKNIKLIIAFLICIILASSIAVYATMNASDINYKNGKTVEYALNELYSKSITVDNLEKLTDGVKYEGEYFMVYEPNKLKWTAAQSENANCEKIIFCHKVAGNNANFTATLPFSLDGKQKNVQLVTKIGDYGWNPDTRHTSGTHLEVDMNYGSPELSEYYFIVMVK